MRIREARLVAPRRIELAERELAAAPGEALIEIAACGYCMTDFHVYEGEDPNVMYPFVLGHEASGVIVETNPLPTDPALEVGTRVTGAFGFAFATHAVAPLRRLFRVPEEVPMEHALGEPLACVVNIARAANPQVGDHVVLIGCGAMGLMLLTCLARSGAASVVAVDVLPERLELSAELGATHTVNPKQTDAAERIRQITEGRGGDVVIEFTGRPVGLALAGEVIRYGRANLLIPGSHMQPATYDLWPLMLKGAIAGFAHPAMSRDFDEDLRRGIAGLCRGLFAMDRILTHRFTLENAAEGFELARTAAEGYLKGLLLPGA
jgi:threonine dehydrogenase-like Zn-dependent dehydrogenase